MCPMYLAPSSILKVGLCRSQKHWSPRRTLKVGEKRRGRGKKHELEMFRVRFEKISMLTVQKEARTNKVKTRILADDNKTKEPSDKR